MAPGNDASKKQIIKEQAKKLFMHFGYSKTSMDDIAAGCGFSKPSLYYYYENKQTLFHDIVLEETRLLLDTIGDEMPQNIAADEKVRFFFNNIFKKLKQFHNELRNTPEVVCSQTLHGHYFVDQLHAVVNAELKPILLEGKESGLFHLEQVDVTLKAINFMTSFLTVDWMRQRKMKDSELIFNETLRLILSGLKGA